MDDIRSGPALNGKRWLKIYRWLKERLRGRKLQKRFPLGEMGVDAYKWYPQLNGIVYEASKSIPGHWRFMTYEFPSPCGFFWLSKPLILKEIGSRIKVFSWVPIFLDQTGGGEIALPPYEPEWEVIRANAVGLTVYYLLEGLYGGRLPIPAARAQRAAIEPTVNIVRLRSVLYKEKGGEGIPVDWSCQWVVRGHWRDQWYPSKEIHQPKWIPSYIKGPDGKPLHHPERLFTVVR